MHYLALSQLASRSATELVADLLAIC